MSNSYPSLTIAVIAAIVGSAAYADTGKTREQVRAETIAAMRDGDIDQGNGFTARSVAPGLYPAAPAIQAKTRAEVKAELEQAIPQGDVDEGNGFMARALSPGLYPPVPTVW